MLTNNLKNLIDNFKILPGIGSKTAERLAFSLLDFDKNSLTNFANSILDVRDNLVFCKKCGNIAEGELCSICLNENRDFSTIFVVEKAKDIVLFEKVATYKGVYHVLNGVISPLDGIGPNEINISKLLERIEKESINEIIFALKPSIEGETTMQYIRKILENKNVKVSKLATGVPIGTDIEYIDSLTLELAIDERKNMD